MTRCSKSLGNKARSIRRLPTSGEGGIRTVAEASANLPRAQLGGAESGAQTADLALAQPLSDLVRLLSELPDGVREQLIALLSRS
jgi:hypothetical protein